MSDLPQKVDGKKVVLLIVLALCLVGVIGWRFILPKLKQKSNTDHPIPISVSSGPAVILQESALALKNERFDQAIGVLQEGLKQYPSNIDLLLQLGITYRKAKNFTQADAMYEEALKVHPDCVECLNNRAVNLLYLGNAWAAVDLLKEAIRKKPTYPEAYLNLGIAYDQSGQTTDALSNYQQYLNLVPSNDSRPDPAVARERIRQLEGSIVQ